MSLFVKRPNGKIEEVELNIFSARRFLAAVQQSGFEAYQNEVNQLRKILENLSVKELTKMYMNLGKCVRELYSEIFEEDPLVRDVMEYSWVPTYKVTQEFVDRYVRYYKRFMLLAAKGRVLSDLLKEKLGKAYQENHEFRRIDEETCKLGESLDFVILAFGSS